MVICDEDIRGIENSGEAKNQKDGFVIEISLCENLKRIALWKANVSKGPQNLHVFNKL